jgi:hypothetical protein
MRAVVENQFGYCGSVWRGFWNRLIQVGPLDLSGLRDVRCPPPIRIAAYFHPKAGFFPALSKYESDDVA